MGSKRTVKDFMGDLRRRSLAQEEVTGECRSGLLVKPGPFRRTRARASSRPLKASDGPEPLKSQVLRVASGRDTRF